MLRLNPSLPRTSVEWVEFANNIPQFQRKRVGGRKRQGMIYEARAHEHFAETLGPGYVKNPWLIYKTSESSSLRWAQPDALLIDPRKGIVTILEMKYQHTSQAYFQLVDKYLPLIERLFGWETWEFATVEVVKWYDCAVKFPCAVTLRERIEDVAAGEFGVHIWKP